MLILSVSVTLAEFSTGQSGFRFNPASGTGLNRVRRWNRPMANQTCLGLHWRPRRHVAVDCKSLGAHGGADFQSLVTPKA